MIPPWTPPFAPGTTPPATTPSTQPGAPGGQTQEGAPSGQTQDSTTAGQTPESPSDQTQQAETEERGGSEAYSGPMFGDIVIPASSFTTNVSPQLLSAAGTTGQPSSAANARLLAGGSGLAGAVFPFHAAFKISENEFPRPVDRVFITYNYYSDVAGSGLAFGAPGAQVHREMAGGEKTFLGGNASVGIRVPVFWTFGSTGVVSSQIGDISVIFKYAFYNNLRTGNAVTAGLLVGVPTGPSLTVPGQSSIRPTQLVPWVGEIWHWGRLYNIDFTSLAVPTDARDVTLFFESFSLAYLAYRNNDSGSILRGVVPDLELHVTVPLDHGSLSNIPIGFPTTVDFTGGCYFFLGRAVLGMACGTPMTGPKPYGFEALASLNYLF
jgi:hypothetical protein